ncbi:MAG TPA: S-layer homology domain-containing protein, partial [Chloroflexia bacterium]|nr:S-layer homology domain-containing protein [Chloroflexia bacterium]
YGVSARAAGDVWAVGFSYVGYTAVPLAEHWDGTRWIVFPADPALTNAVFYSVTTGAANDAWAAGDYETYGSSGQPFIEHWDGTRWTVVPSPNPGSNLAVGLSSIVEGAAADVWAVGSYDEDNIQRPLVEHWDGHQWSLAPSVEPAPLNSYLSGVASTGPGDSWIVGDYFPGVFRTLAEHYTDPCVTPSPTPPPTHTPPGLPTATVTRTPTNSPTAAPPTRTPTAGPSPTPCVVPFSDVAARDYFYLQVEYLACHGVISGYADGTFRPYTGTTRAQTVKIAVLGFGLPLATPTAAAFADVPPGAPFFAVISTAAQAQIVSGYACGGAGEPCDSQDRPYFRPYAAITRGQLAKIVVVTAGWVLQTPAAATFADVFPGTAFYSFVETAYCHGAISGYNCGGPGEPCDGGNHPYFRPGNNAVRAQIATIVYGALHNGGGCLRRRPFGPGP